MPLIHDAHIIGAFILNKCCLSHGKPTYSSLKLDDLQKEDHLRLTKPTNRGSRGLGNDLNS